MVSRAPEPSPGVLPWRPVTPAEILTGAYRCIRLSPAAMLGVSVIVAVTTALGSRGATAGLTALGLPSNGALASGITDSINLAGAIVAAGALAVVAGRALFGDVTTLRQTWALLRPRLPALLGLAAVAAVPGAGLLGVLLSALTIPVNHDPSGLIALLALCVALLLCACGYTLLCFAPAVLTLERRSVAAAVRRAVTLSFPGAPRIFGVLVLTMLATSLLAAAVSLPCTLADRLLGTGRAATAVTLAGDLLGDVVVIAFAAGAITLLYVDRRMRGEAFDVRSRAASGPAPAPGGPPDDRWLPDPPR